MKKFVLTLLFIFSFLSSGFSQDAIQTIDPVSTLQAQVPSAFSLIVTGDGKLITKPGPAFTEGGNYEEVQLPYLISTPKAIPYPDWAIQEGWEVHFVIAVEVLADGSVGRHEIMESTGNSSLDETATQTVKTWKFHPAMKGGEPIVECIQIPVAFRLSAE